tara:strand:- start:115 stop:441 length:327 start_codon:yes stop_codon:yes gene_type:complete
VTYKKGSLVLISNGEQASTCIILTSKYEVTGVDAHNFYYTYCIETGLYGVVYENEIVSLVVADFAPDFEFHSELFETDYALHAHLYESFSYYPGIQGWKDDDESTEDD